MSAPVVYLDTCALNRVSDDRSQPRIRNEADAVLDILDQVAGGQLSWIASTVLQREMARNPDPIRRIDTLRLLSAASHMVEPSPDTFQRAVHLIEQGFSPPDTLHLAVAQQADAEWFITTDDRLISLARRKTDNLHPEVVNPVNLLQRRHP